MGETTNGTVSALSQFSVKDLFEEIGSRVRGAKSQLTEFEAQVDRLQSEFPKAASPAPVVTMAAPAAETPRKRVAKKASKKVAKDKAPKPPKAARAPRAKNEKPLKDYVAKVLSENTEGCTIPEMETKVKESGYTSNAKDFRNILYQCVYNMEGVKHDETTGKYQLVTPAATA